MASVAPWLSVRQGAEAVEYYKAAFGAVELHRHENDSGEIVAQLPPSDKVAKALTAVQRNASTIASLAHRAATDPPDGSLVQLALSLPDEEF